MFGQTVLFAAVGFLALRFRAAGFHPVILILGAILSGIGVGVVLAGALTLGRNLTPFPKPRDKTQLVQHGIYSVIRHPLYTAVIFIAFGWALLCQSWPALLAALTLIPFFHVKAGREERWLRQKFPEYGDYERCVRRFIPWVY